MCLEDIRNFFDAFALQWNAHFKSEQRQRLHRIVSSHLSFLQGPVLDLGCGTGILLDVLEHELHAPPEVVVELDLSLKMLAQIPTKPSLYSTKIFRIQADGQRLPLQSASMNSVVAFQVFPHFQHFDLLAREVLRVLKPSGYFCVLHLHDHRQLNEIHRSLHPTVRNHTMLPASALKTFLANHGFFPRQATEANDLYLVLVQKPLSRPF